jgi:glyoxylase-like metal-dependent hydrolase (beta-lactamase superfamily II)
VWVFTAWGTTQSNTSEYLKSLLVTSSWRRPPRAQPDDDGYRRSRFDYRTVDFHRGKVDSYASFGRTFGLLGDGSIHFAYTPVHSAGHMSIICRLEKHDFVIGGDCFYPEGQLDGSESPPPRPQDAHNARRSLQELRLFCSQLPDAVITPGHDPDFYGQVERQYR